MLSIQRQIAPLLAKYDPSSFTCSLKPDLGLEALTLSVRFILDLCHLCKAPCLLVVDPKAPQASGNQEASRPSA